MVAWLIRTAARIEMRLLTSTAIFLFGLAGLEARAAILFSDSYYVPGTGNTGDVNYNVNNSVAPRTGGTYGGGTIGYYLGGNVQAGNSTGSPPLPDGNYLLTATNGWAEVGHDFSADANTAAMPLTISFDAAPSINQNGTEWLSLNIGQGPNDGSGVNNGGLPLGILYRNTGTSQVFQYGNLITPTEPTWGSSSNTKNHFQVVLTGQNGTGSPFGSNGYQAQYYANGNLFFTANSATALPTGYFSFNSSGGNVGGTDNLAVTTGTTWMPQAGGSWANSANWTGGAVPNAPGAQANIVPTLINGSTPFSDTITLDGNQTVGYLGFTNAANGGAFTLSQGTGGTLTLDNQGAGASINNWLSNNVVSAPILLNDNAQFNAGAGSTLTISGSIAATGSQTVTVNQGTAGTVVFASPNTYTGGTTIAGGTLVLSDPNGLGTAGANINNGAQLTLNHNGTTSNPINLVGNTQTIFLNPGTPTLTGNITTDGSAGVLNIYSFGRQAGTQNVTLNGNTITLGAKSLNINGQNGGNVDSNADAYGQLTTLANATLSTAANVSVGRAALNVQGNSSVTIGGQLLASSDWAAFSMQDNSSVTVTGGIDFVNGHVATDLALNGGTLTTPFIYGNDYAGTTHVTFNGTYIIASASSTDFLQVHVNGSGDPHSAAALIANGGATFDTNGNNVTINALLYDYSGQSGMLIKNGDGVLALANAGNAYSGLTILAGGTLNVASLSNYGSASSIGDRASDDAAGGNQGDVGILFRGGTLQYTGATAQSTNRSIRINVPGGDGYGGNATIDASGSNPQATISFTAASSVNFFEEPGSRTLTLTGSNAGPNLFAMAIQEAGGATNLVKSGAGMWVLTGANGYSGGTSINGGSLQLGNGSGGSSLGSGPIVNNAVLAYDAGQGNELDLSGNSFSGSGTININSGDLHVGAGGVSSGSIAIASDANGNGNGDLTIWAPGPIALSNNFVLNSMGAGQTRGAINQDGGPGLVTLNGNIDLAGSSRISSGGASWNYLLINGQLSGTGQLYVYEYTANTNVPATALILANSANSNSGGIVMENGLLDATNATALGSGSVSNTSGNGELLVDETSGTIANNITLAGTSVAGNQPYVGTAALYLHNDSQNLTFSGSITLAGDTKIRGYSSGGITNFSQPIGGTGALTFEAGGAASNHTQYWNLQGGPSTYNGATNINSDGSANSYVTLQGGALPATTTLSMQDVSFVGGNDAVLDLNGYNQTLAGLYNVHGAGGLGSFITNSAAGQSLLTVSSGSFSGIIGANTTGGATGQGSGGNNIALDKTGAGTLVLDGANTYVGGTTVGGGVLQLGNAAALGSGALAANGGTLDLAGNSITVTSFSGAAGVVTTSLSGTLTTLTADQSTTTTFGGAINDGAGKVALSLTGPGTLVLTGTNEFTGGTAVAGGTLILADIEALADGSSLTVGDASAFTGILPAGSAQGGSQTASVPSLAAVPEPGTALLALAGCGLVVWFRRRVYSITTPVKSD